MFNLLFAVVLNIATLNQPACETVGPRVDGIKVTICAGQVVRYEDQFGNVRNLSDY